MRVILPVRFVVSEDIDVAGWPTTFGLRPAAVPPISPSAAAEGGESQGGAAHVEDGFVHAPAASAPSVRKLLACGATLVQDGKVRT